jgi:hypothetical protein
MNPKCPSFKLLQKQWYEKLAKEGFKDIENVDTDTLKTYSLSRSSGSDHSIHDKYGDKRMRDVYRKRFKERYYDLCRHIMFHPKYLDLIKDHPGRQKIWEMHAEGERQHIIATKMNMSRTNVRWILNKFIPLVMESNTEKYDESDSD